MNIKEAKDGIKQIIETYLDKDVYGNYSIPYMKQRPVFLIGAPGIGKTAIMEQIAQELDLPLVSYSITHHTRQSAIGLPIIKNRNFGGIQASVSEYTMSEIVASVYQMTEQTGKKEGILFLDEVNCVSETLAPAMLLFLQYKTFGGHRIPEGWVIITAGNPPQFNKSVREFDVATRDRLRCMEVTEDFTVWKEYAYAAGIHGAILSFLEIHKDWFFSIRETVDGTACVTARGWEDLSRSIFVYEKKGFSVNRTLAGQYLTDEEISRKFCIYYDLYKKYREDYQVDRILSGEYDIALNQKAAAARFDERLALLSLLMDKIGEIACEIVRTDDVLEAVVKNLRRIKKKSGSMPDAVLKMLDDCIREQQEYLQAHIAARSISEEGKIQIFEMLEIYRELLEKAEKEEDDNKRFNTVKKCFTLRTKAQQKSISRCQDMLEQAFSFTVKTWGEKQELVLLMTELTANKNTLAFIERFGSEKYDHYNKSLLIFDKREDLRRNIEALEL